MREWFGRAALTGSLIIGVGVLFGGLLGLVAGVETGGLVALCIVAIVGIFAGIYRLGGSGFALGLLGGVAAFLGASDVRYAVVARGDLQTLASLADWDPGAGASRLRIARVESGERFAATASKTHRGGKGGTTTVRYDAAPWMERGRVVGYACTVSSRWSVSAASGEFAMSVEAREGLRDEMCARAIDQSETLVRRAGVQMAPNAASRVVRVYASAEELRADHAVARAFWGPGVVLGIYLLGLLVVRLVRDRKSPAPRVD